MGEGEGGRGLREAGVVLRREGGGGCGLWTSQGVVIARLLRWLFVRA